MWGFKGTKSLIFKLTAILANSNHNCSDTLTLSSSLSALKGASLVAGPLRLGAKYCNVSISTAPRTMPGGTPFSGSLLWASAALIACSAKSGHRSARILAHSKYQSPRHLAIRVRWGQEFSFCQRDFQSSYPWE